MTRALTTTLFIVLLLSSTAVLDCKESTEHGGDTMTVAVTIPPYKSLVEAVGGQRVHGVVLLPPGTSPHSLEPTPSIMAKAASAALYLEVGHPSLAIEQKIAKTLEEVAPQVPRVDLSEGMTFDALDAHVWTAPSVTKQHVAAIRDALVALDPGHALEYKANATELLAAIDALVAKYEPVFAGLQERRFMVYHPAWGYLAKDFGLTQVAVEDDGHAPGSKHLGELVEAAKAMGAKVIFVDPAFDSKSASLVAEEVGADVVTLDPLAEDWLATMDTALAALAKALGKEVP